MEQKSNTIDIRRLWRAIVQCKWVYLAFILLFTGAAAWISFRSLTRYEIQGNMLIGDEESSSSSKGGGLAQMMKTFSVGGFGASSVDNEVLIIKSHDVMLRTVRALGLNRTYFGKDADGDKAMLYSELPVRVEAPAEYFDTLHQSFSINISLIGDSKADIKVTKGFFKRTVKEVNGVTLPAMLETPYGNFQIIRTDLFESTPYRTISVNVTGNDAAAIGLGKSLDIDVTSKVADAITVGLKYPNTDLGKAIVDGVMTEYNAKRLNRLHESAEASIKYYDERIAEVFKTLEESEKDVADYQKSNNLFVPATEAEMKVLIPTMYSNKEAIVKANYDINYYEMVLSTLKERLNDDVIIPQIESLNDPNIMAFNGAIMARRDLQRSATDKNEQMILLNKRIEGLRSIIIENSEKHIAKAKADLQIQKQMSGRTESRINSFPNYELEYTTLMRSKEYQNALYLYLIQQRESFILQLYSNNNLGFIYQPAYVVDSSGMLRKLILPVAAFIFALFAATCIALLVMLLTQKVKSPMDVAFMGIESRTLMFDGRRDDATRLRTLITADPARRVLYFARLGDTGDMPAAFIETLASINASVEVISGLSDNDEILTPAIQSRIENALTDTAFVIVNVPDAANLSIIENLITDTDSALIVNMPCDTISRKQLKSILKGQPADKVFATIYRKK